MNSAGATKGSTSISAGGTVRSASDKSMKDEGVDSSPYHEGEKVLAFHGPCIYDAKIQKVEFQADEWRYYVHYHGWNKNWDEWLGVESLLKLTEENVQKQKELKEKHSKPERLSQDKAKTSAGGVRGRKRKHEVVEKEVVAPVEKLNIQIPSTLKKQLVDDHEHITHLSKLVKLPRSPTVADILSKFIEIQTSNNDGIIVDTIVEVVDGLRCYFDKALPAMLLYRQERQQYRETMTENTSPSRVYGAEHLLRLFVKLPELLSYMHIEKKTLTELQHRLQEVLRFLQAHQNAFFRRNYHKLEGTEGVKREDNG